MSGPSTYEPKYAAAKWMDKRLPIIRMSVDFMGFPSPRNLNYWYAFGGILTLCLISQIITGIILAMHYTPSVDAAFDSVQRIKRDVPFGWLLQSMHAVGASMFFLAVYIHMFRGLYYGSYKAPRELLWIIGCAIYLAMMATGFPGLYTAMGANELLGRDCDYGLFWRYSGCRRELAAMAAGWILRWQSNATALLLTALSIAIYYLRIGRPSRLGGSPCGTEQPDWH